MKEFLDFFLSNHLGPILIFCILILISANEFFKSFFSFLNTKYLDDERYTNDFLENINLALIPLSLLAFIIIDFQQPNDMLAKFIYFIISMGTIFLSIAYYYNNNKDK